MDLLDEKEKEKAFTLVGCDNSRIREAVGTFIFENVLREGEEEISKLTGKASKKGSDKLLEIQKKQLVTLVDFILESHPIPDMPSYVVDSLWGKTKLLQVCCDHYLSTLPYAPTVELECDGSSP